MHGIECLTQNHIELKSILLHSRQFICEVFEVDGGHVELVSMKLHEVFFPVSHPEKGWKKTLPK